MTSTTHSPILTIKDLHKSFGESHIMRGVNLTLEKGERHAIIGPNGAGKSTLFHLISGLLRPQQRHHTFGFPPYSRHGPTTY